MLLRSTCASLVGVPCHLPLRRHIPGGAWARWHGHVPMVAWIQSFYPSTMFRPRAAGYRMNFNYFSNILTNLIVLFINCQTYLFFVLIKRWFSSTAGEDSLRFSLVNRFPVSRWTEAIKFLKGSSWLWVLKWTSAFSWVWLPRHTDCAVIEHVIIETLSNENGGTDDNKETTLKTIAVRWKPSSWAPARSCC